MSTRSPQHGACFGFYWDTDEDERERVYAQADALISAAIRDLASSPG